MGREHTCSEPDCGHYTWNHTAPDVPGGCLAIVGAGQVCGCLRQYKDGIKNPNVFDPDPKIAKS